MKSKDLLLKARKDVGDQTIFIFTYEELKMYVNLIVSEAWENSNK